MFGIKPTYFFKSTTHNMPSINMYATVVRRRNNEYALRIKSISDIMIVVRKIGDANIELIAT